MAFGPVTQRLLEEALAGRESRGAPTRPSRTATSQTGLALTHEQRLFDIAQRGFERSSNPEIRAQFEGLARSIEPSFNFSPSQQGNVDILNVPGVRRTLEAVGGDFFGDAQTQGGQHTPAATTEVPDSAPAQTVLSLD